VLFKKTGVRQLYCPECHDWNKRRHTDIANEKKRIEALTAPKPKFYCDGCNELIQLDFFPLTPGSGWTKFECPHCGKKIGH